VIRYVKCLSYTYRTLVVHQLQMV